MGRLFIWVTCLVISCNCAKQLPSDFIIGAGTSAFQVEGGWDEDGKGESIWDRFFHDKSAAENGDIACDSYHKWEEDVANAKALGLNYYRFSIAWARILPDGTLNHINQNGVDYYLNLINGLKAEGIEPMITLYHWDMPQHIQDLGGFLNPQTVDYFGDYARLVYQLYAPYVKYWITINEPIQICRDGYGTGGSAPGLKLIGDGIYQCSYVLLKAHARAYRIYDEEFKPTYNGQVGIVINYDWMEPASTSELDLIAQERHIEFTLGWWSNPIFLGNWPQIMIDRIANRSALEGLSRSRLPEFTQEEIDYINGTHDFFGLNTYSVGQVQYTPDPDISEPSYNLDRSVNQYYDSSFHYPEGLRTSVNYINKKYQPKGIIVTENGQRTNDTLEDDERITTIKEFLGALLDARLEDGVNVFGYTVWSLMDNFEWGSYEAKFGIIRVDFDSENRTRTWKKSALWYQNLTATRILED